MWDRGIILYWIHSRPPRNENSYILNHLARKQWRDNVSCHPQIESLSVIFFKGQNIPTCLRVHTAYECEYICVSFISRSISKLGVEPTSSLRTINKYGHFWVCAVINGSCFCTLFDLFIRTSFKTYYLIPIEVIFVRLDWNQKHNTRHPSLLWRHD